MDYRTDLQAPCCQYVFRDDDFSSKGITCRQCGTQFPIVNNIPILIDESESVFSHLDFLEAKNLFFDISLWGKVKSGIAKSIPSLQTSNAKQQFTELKNRLLTSATCPPRVLILGGSIAGSGMKDFLDTQEIIFVESDVSFGPRTQIVLDAHSIPYQDKSFDAVVAQAVLEHVQDPHKCAAEIFRVLKKDGIVYSEIPFMQQVHGGAYDFTRFTQSGHRRLFRQFEELKSGACAGAGSSMAWAYQYLMLGLFGYTHQLRLVVKTLSRITGFWLKYFDYLERPNKRRADGASGTFFMGKKSDKVLSDKELISYYQKQVG